MFSRLLGLAAHALAEAESRPEPQDLWEEPIGPTTWKRCADERNWELCDGRNGYIIVSANGGINQQRVAKEREKKKRDKKREKKIRGVLFARAIRHPWAVSSPCAGRRKVSPRGEKE
ncbi:hypothetical protein BHE74_00023446 [Ensete ventricosum]|nr:hypothetical protein BHE74_00023446 [Ensete ventricosum]